MKINNKQMKNTVLIRYYNLISVLKNNYRILILLNKVSNNLILISQIKLAKIILLIKIINYLQLTIKSFKIYL